MKKHLQEYGFCYLVTILAILFLNAVVYDQITSRKKYIEQRKIEWKAAIKNVNKDGIVEYRNELYTIERAKKRVKSMGKFKQIRGQK